MYKKSQLLFHSSVNCPCGSGFVYEECCAPYHEGKKSAPTPLALMRSRYSAYALGKIDYIIETTHPQTRPKDLMQWKEELIFFSKHTEFISLEIVEARGDFVHFKAHVKQEGKPYILEEKSRFVKVEGKWTYWP